MIKLTDLVGKQVSIEYRTDGRVQFCRGELQWSPELQRFCVVKNDEDWKDRVEFCAADVHRLSKNSVGHLIVVPNAVRVRKVGSWRAEKVQHPDKGKKMLVGFQVVTDTAEHGRTVIADIFPRPYLVDVNANHAALMAAAPDLYAEAKRTLAALDASTAAMYINGLNCNALRLAIEKAQRMVG